MSAIVPVDYLACCECGDDASETIWSVHESQLDFVEVVRRAINGWDSGKNEVVNCQEMTDLKHQEGGLLV